MADDEVEKIMNKTSLTGVGYISTLPMQMVAVQQRLLQQQVEMMHAAARMNPFLSPFV